MEKVKYMNGKVLTLDQEEIAQGFVIQGDRFILVGSNDELQAVEADKIVDLRGRWVIPGLNDSHMHLINYSLSRKKVDLRHCRSLEEVKRAIESYMEGEDYGFFGDWIIGHGWNEENFQGGTLPTAAFLDEITREVPIFLTRACYHVGVVNTLGLERAGIQENTPDPEGGKIDRDPGTQKPTGILREHALGLVYQQIPPIGQVGQLKQLISQGIQDALQVGLTSIQTDDFGVVEDYQQVIQAYQELEQEGNLKIRINQQMLFYTKESLQQALDQGIRTGKGSGYYRLGPLKLLADGSLGGRTAALKADYEDDPENRGMLIYSDEDLKEIFQLALAHGLQLAVHAIGDGAMAQVLRCYRAVLPPGQIPERGLRLVHCQITDEEILQEMAQLGIIADIQPGFLTTDLKIIESRVGAERGRTSYAWKTMLERGISVAAGSDCPIESLNPFVGMAGGVKRQDPAGLPREGWHPEERLSFQEALRLYTLGASYATFEEQEKGKIAPGYYADFLILEGDLEEAIPRSIEDIKVAATYVGGRCQYHQP